MKYLDQSHANWIAKLIMRDALLVFRMLPGITVEED
jgi:hypothetical protein